MLRLRLRKKEGKVQDFLSIKFWNNTILDYIYFFGSLLASLIIILLFRHILLKLILKRSKNSPTSLDGMIVRSIKIYLIPMLYALALYLNLKWLTLSDGAARVVDIAAQVLLTIFGAAIISAILVFVVNKYIEKRYKGGEKANWIRVIIRAVVWICALLLFLDNIGVHITALVAGLGIGGIAVAFAAQAVLEDIFSFVTIYFDKPFETGDYITVDDLMGTVEHIGVKTTRLRSINGEQLVFSNKDLTSSRVHNYKKIEKRRVLFTIVVTYDTPSEKLKEIPGMIKKAVESMEKTSFDRSHFKEFTESGLKFETVYYVLSEDYNLYMDIQQAVNLSIKEALDKSGIEFAFPTRMVYLQKHGGENIS